MMNENPKGSNTPGAAAVACTDLLADSIWLPAIFAINCLTCLVCIIGLAAYKDINARTSKLEEMLLSESNNQSRILPRSSQQSQTSPRLANVAFPTSSAWNPNAQVGVVASQSRRLDGSDLYPAHYYGTIPAPPVCNQSTSLSQPSTANYSYKANEKGQR
jgi:hypothetical protein